MKLCTLNGPLPGIILPNAQGHCKIVSARQFSKQRGTFRKRIINYLSSRAQPLVVPSFLFIAVRKVNGEEADMLSVSEVSRGT